MVFVRDVRPPAGKTYRRQYPTNASATRPVPTIDAYLLPRSIRSGMDYRIGRSNGAEPGEEFDSTPAVAASDETDDV